MQKNKIKHLIFTFICILVAVILYSIPYNFITQFENNMLITKEEIYQLQNKSFSFLVNSEIMKVSAINDEEDKTMNEYTIKFKLFNLFNIKNLKVQIAEQDGIYSGGECVGISLKSKGVVVVGSNYIITKQGNFNPFKESELRVGDVILKINETEIGNMADITGLLDVCKPNEELNLHVMRKGESLNLKIKPALDVQTNKYKLGLWIRDDAVGVGTLTFVNNQNKRFGTLGHAIIDSDTGVKFEVNNGEIYKCNVVGVKKGKKGIPGELIGLFMYGENNKLGEVDKNTENGVYGNIINDKLTENKHVYEIGGRLTAKPGKAKILSCIEGTEVKEYDIEIIKTNYQSKPNEKSMVIKITDKELLEKTGGIVQGMSGSPIIQNGKVIGAVTHVFVNDPTKGFGLYLDWMITE